MGDTIENTDPLLTELIRTTALGVVLIALLVLLRRVRRSTQPGERLRTVFAMLIAAAAALILFGVASGRGEFVGLGVAIGLCGALVVVSARNSDRGPRPKS